LSAINAFTMRSYSAAGRRRVPMIFQHKINRTNPA
jgi:hypothetical protein